MTKAKDYYESLGLKRGATPEEIKRAYRRLARKYHPDLNPGDKASEEKFKEINEAYSVLGDPKKKDGYDRFGTAEFAGGPWFEGMKRGAPKGFEDIFGGGIGEMFSDVFGMGGMGRRAQTLPRRGADAVLDMTVGLDEAFTGVTKKINISREAPCASCGGTGAEAQSPCTSCGGSGRIQTSRGFFRMTEGCPECGGRGMKVTKECRACGGRGSTAKTETLNVKIPAGVDGDSVLRISGKGNAGTQGGPPGDLHIRVIVREHPFFKRKGGDIFIDAPVTFGEAALGAKIEVPTLEGKTVMTLPQGTQGGQRFKLKGKGFPAPKTGKRGDMYVNVKIAVPGEMSQRAKEAVREIEASYKESPRKGFFRS